MSKISKLKVTIFLSALFVFINLFLILFAYIRLFESYKDYGAAVPMGILLIVFILLSLFFRSKLSTNESKSYWLMVIIVLSFFQIIMAYLTIHK